jgi:hypothetical protein
MNSHQRRKFDRKWKHSVVVYIDRWSQHLEIHEWCEKNFGKMGNRWHNIASYTPFVFKNEKDCVLFILRWV